MKKTDFLILTVLILSLISGCKKDHTYEVKIVLEGDAITRHILNQPYTDAGAYGVDFMNKQLQATIDISDVNVDKAGTYTVNISSTDEYGNVGTATRTVVVYNELEYLNGTWTFSKYPQGSGTPDTVYFEELKASGTENRLFTFTRFSNYENAPVAGHIFANLITIDSLNYNVGASQNIPVTFFGDGLQMDENRLEINYKEIINNQTFQYTAAIVRQ